MQINDSHLIIQVNYIEGVARRLYIACGTMWYGYYSVVLELPYVTVTTVYSSGYACHVNETRSRLVVDCGRGGSRFTRLEEVLSRPKRRNCRYFEMPD